MVVFWYRYLLKSGEYSSSSLDFKFKTILQWGINAGSMQKAYSVGASDSPHRYNQKILFGALPIQNGSIPAHINQKKLLT